MKPWRFGGLGEGPYLMLPLYGPSNPRDAVGLGVLQFRRSPGRLFANQPRQRASEIRLGLTAVSRRERYLDELDDLQRTSLDDHAALRSLYRQHRNDQIAKARSGLTALMHRAPKMAWRM